MTKMVRLIGVVALAAAFTFGGLAIWYHASHDQSTYIGLAIFSFVASIIVLEWADGSDAVEDDKPS